VRAAITAADPGYTALSEAADMDKAVALAARAAEPGDVVLLAPGGTSYDAYRDFEERGQEFRRAVQARAAAVRA
jgi:UDP-N-acetylmuramoylalanine--D-glutamate ligase